ncbi:MAG: AbrB/MazE/SpoVT family DNA-binding domain-containing protein [Chloroflexi bacterium]|nr:AbrB/MazE/SpoVT family DNA-binding domain-containing protein [Chloroflexota bacterium]
MASQVSERGQITIDQSIRKQLGIQPGMIAYQRVTNGRLEVIFLPAPHRRSLSGVFYRQGEGVKVATGDDLEEAVMEAVADELAQVEGKRA